MLSPSAGTGAAVTAFFGFHACVSVSYLILGSWWRQVQNEELPVRKTNSRPKAKAVYNPAYPSCQPQVRYLWIQFIGPLIHVGLKWNDCPLVRALEHCTLLLTAVGTRGCREEAEGHDTAASCH